MDMKLIYMEETIALINSRGGSISVDGKDVQWKDTYVVLTDVIIKDNG